MGSTWRKPRVQAVHQSSRGPPWNSNKANMLHPRYGQLDNDVAQYTYHIIILTNACNCNYLEVPRSPDLRSPGCSWSWSTDLKSQKMSKPTDRNGRIKQWKLGAQRNVVATNIPSLKPSNGMQRAQATGSTGQHLAADQRHHFSCSSFLTRLPKERHQTGPTPTLDW